MARQSVGGGRNERIIHVIGPQTVMTSLTIGGGWVSPQHYHNPSSLYSITGSPHHTKITHGQNFK